MKELLNKKLSLRPDDGPYNTPGTLKFIADDSEELYKSNLQIQNSDWHYRTKKVEYKLNSAGFRCPEFDTIDWQNAIVLHGCSQVFGVGIAEDETVTAQLRQLTDRPVINLGKVGASVTYTLANNMLLENNFPKPFAVINHWPSIWRDTIFTSDRNKYVDGGKLMQQKYAQLRLYKKIDISFSDVLEDVTAKAQMMNHLCKTLWRGTNYIETTWVDHTAEELGCYLQECLDFARDVRHIKSEDVLVDEDTENILRTEARTSQISSDVNEPVAKPTHIAHNGPKTAKALAEYYSDLLK